jgi:hypothetical protein
MSAALELLDRVDIVEDDVMPGLLVKPIWKGVDRPYVGGWGIPIDARPLAERLKRAIEAGAVYKDARIETDVDGRTYVATTQVRIVGRGMSADLERLGY